MIIFFGRYSWDGTKKDDRDPISWFPGAYDLIITNLTEAGDNLAYIRPYLCIFTNTGSGYSVSANPEKFAKRICEDFSLELDKVLWVERKEPDTENFEIVVFQRKGQMGETIFYSLEKRMPLTNELRVIKKQINYCESMEQPRDVMRG